MFIPAVRYTDNPYFVKSIPKRIVIFSGAGLSAPSGISTFRDSDGLWENNKISEICDERSWKHNFQKVHDFYNERRLDLVNKQPNNGHKMIRELYNLFPNDVYNITQNVDDLFEKAGFDNNSVLHVHGFLPELKCEACGSKNNINYGIFDVDSDRCINCNSVKGVRPNIVFFNGAAPMYKYMYRAFRYLMNEDSIFLVIGTSGTVIDLIDTLKITNCKKILCNLTPSDTLPDELFDNVFYESIDTAADKIKELVLEYWMKDDCDGQ